MFLTRDELCELTNRRQARAQAAQLRAMGIEHRQRADGSLVVLRAHVEALLGLSASDRVRAPVEPDWDAMKPPRPRHAAPRKAA